MEGMVNTSRGFNGLRPTQNDSSCFSIFSLSLSLSNKSPHLFFSLLFISLSLSVMMYTRSSGNRVGGITSASRFLLFFLLRWIWGCLNSCSLAIECPTACRGLTEPIGFPFGANPLCGAPGFVLNCSNASAPEFPLWSPLEDGPGTSLQRKFSVLEIHPTNLSKGSALVSLTAFPPRPPCFNSTNYTGGGSPNKFDLISAIDILTTSGNNWVISHNTSFVLAGCSTVPRSKDQSPLRLKLCASSYSIRSCTDSQQFLCFTADWVSIQSLAADCDCRYFRSFVPNVREVNNQPVLAIEWSVDQNLAAQCTSCADTNQSCVLNNDSIKPRKVICAKCEGGKCEESSSLASGPAGGSLPSRFQIVFGVAGSSLGFLLLVLLLIVWARRRKWKIQVPHVRLRRSFHKIISSNTSNMTNSSGNNSKLLQALAEQAGPIPTTIYSYEELRHATGAFSDAKLLGDGGFGSVYEGLLYNRQKVAVKRLYHNSYRRLEQFVNEIRILSCLEHPNLIKLYGFCYHEEPKDLLLVYEFAPHGSLADHLHGGQYKAERLTWQTRLQVALETAVALEYLHFMVEPPIFHRDVKSANILLDDNFHAKLADFGLSRSVPPLASHVSTAPQGTPGYVDPEYHQCYQLTDKSDVYSFGVVVMEIVSGKVAVDMNRDRREINLSHLALSMIQKGAMEELIDPHLHIDRCPAVRDMARGVAELAFQCLAADKDDRPTMKEVVVELRRIERMGPWSTCPSIPSVKQPLWRNNSLEDTGVGENQQQKHPSKEGEPTLLLSPTSVQSRPWNSSESPPDSM